MSEEDLRNLLLQLRMQQMPEISSDTYRFYGNPAIPEEAAVPEYMRAMASQFARFARTFDTGSGKVGVSYGNDPGQQGARVSYENQMNTLGGLLGLSGEIGKGFKKGSATYNSQNAPLRMQASITEDQFGNLIKALEAQYVKQLANNWALGIGAGSVNNMPMMNLQLRGKF